MASAEAEPDREDGRTRRDVVGPKMSHRGRDIVLNAVRRRLLDVRHVLEILATFLHTRSAPEVVERHSRIAALGKAQRELLVEPVEPANVGQDDHPDAAGRLGKSCEGREAVAVLSLENEISMRDGGAGDPRNGRSGIQVEAHAATISPAGCLRALGDESVEDQAKVVDGRLDVTA